jgi:membrane associated rhomboid family serine protease
MKEKRSWSEKPIPSLIISIIGLLFIIFALANLLGLVKEPIKNTSSIFGIVFGLILMYPIFKKKKKKN